MNDVAQVSCPTCEKTPAGFFERYRGFLFSPGTLIAGANALLLLLGFVMGLLGQSRVADWLYLASAVIGGAPILKPLPGRSRGEWTRCCGTGRPQPRPRAGTA